MAVPLLARIVCQSIKTILLHVFIIIVCVCVCSLSCALCSSLSALHSSVQVSTCCYIHLYICMYMEEDSKEETGLWCRSSTIYWACCCWVPVPAGVANSPVDGGGKGEEMGMREQRQQQYAKKTPTRNSSSAGNKQ